MFALICILIGSDDAMQDIVIVHSNSACILGYSKRGEGATFGIFKRVGELSSRAPAKMSGSEFEVALIDISAFNSEGTPDSEWRDSLSATLFPDADRDHVLKQPHINGSLMPQCTLITLPANDFDLQHNLGYSINVIHESRFIELEGISSGLAHAVTSVRHHDAPTKRRRYQRFGGVLTLKIDGF